MPSAPRFLPALPLLLALCSCGPSLIGIVAVGGGSGRTANSAAPTLFEPPVRIATDAPLVALATADLNSDGILDAVVSQGLFHPTTLLVFHGQGARGVGNGRFTKVQELPMGATAYEIVVADFDKNGSQDLAVISQGSNSLWVFPGDGSGQFLPLAAAQYMGVNVPAAMVAADLNADGILDLAVSNIGSFARPQSTISIFRGNGTNGRGAGTFLFDREYPTGTFPLDIVVGDFNSDAIPDLAVACGGSSESAGIHLGVGDGTLAPYSPLALPGVFIGSALTTGDFNGDGITDLGVALFSAHIVAILTGQGSGGRGDGRFVFGPVLATGLQPRSIVATDFNHDGITDLATCSFLATGVCCHLGRGGNQRGQFEPMIRAPVAAILFMLAAADFNGDGQVDILASDFTPETAGLQVLLGRR